MQKLKKPVSILLVFMMIVSLFAAVPMTVNAAPPGGSEPGPGGTEIGTGTVITPTAVGDYLTFTAEEAGSSVTLNVYSGGSNLQYDLNGTGLTAYTPGTTITLASAGDYVRFRGKDTIFNNSNYVSIDGKVACSGNVMSLRLDDDGKVQGLSNRCFNYMFKDCTGLTAAPELPETTLATYCYSNMFSGCTSLTTAPELPATMLAESCYDSMFYGCRRLTTAPELPATMLAESCYYNMFSGCTRLTEAPELWATTLAGDCYNSMFDGCESLTTAPELPATTLEYGCYSYMFHGCERLTTAPELPATELKSNCYSYMFAGCSSIKLSETQTDEYSIPYSVPSGGNGTTASSALQNMFAETGGTFAGTPEINKTYYRPDGKYTVTDESVNGTVTAIVNDTDVTEAAPDDAVLLNVAPAAGYQFKSITAVAEKESAENLGDLIALMGDAVADGYDGEFDGYTFKVEDGKFVIYNGSTLFAELSESDVSDFQVGDDETYAENGDEEWYFTLSDNKITEFYWQNNTTYDYFYTNEFESTGTLQPVQVDLTTVAEGSQYSFTMPAKNVTVKAEFEEAAPAPAPAKLILNVGENGKVVMNNGTFGNATDASNISEIHAPVNVADGYNASIANVSIADGHSVNLVEGGSINIAAGGEVSFYPSADNTGKITAIPDEGYICTGWYNGDTRYTTKDTIDYQAISEDMTLTAKFAPDLFPQHSITLGGNIGVNFYINSAAANFASASEATVKFTWDNGNYHEEVNLKELTTDGDGYYKATVDVVAAQMAHKIHAEVWLNGAKLDQTDDYSVQDYAETVYANPEAYDTKGKPDELKALVKALLNYGAMAQTVFYNSLKEHPALANTTVGDNGYAAVTAEQIGAAIKGESADLNAVATQLGAKYYTSSLIYLSKNTLRVYFTPTTYPGTIPNADKYAGNLSDYYYYVDHANIPAAELDEQKELTVGDYTFTYTALDYAKAVVNSGMGDDQKNLAKSLYLYNQKANAYFDAAPAPAEKILVLDNVTEDTTVEDGYTVTGTLQDDYKISIADGATVTLKDVNITCLSNDKATVNFAGITPLGDATILLEGANTVKGGYENYPGVFVPVGKTLTIDGTGSLNASSNGYGCGIGGGCEIQAGNIVINGGNIVINGGTIIATGGKYAAGIGSGGNCSCGNITITGGTITANGGAQAAGIGSGYDDDATCGNILITGGTVTATGGNNAAGIGSGAFGASCGNITIADTVTQVTATKGATMPSNSIGKGFGGTCGTVTIEDGANVTQN